MMNRYMRILLCAGLFVLMSCSQISFDKDFLGDRPESSGADIGYTLELVDGLRIFVQLWHGDEEFAPRVRCLWDENTKMYLRYETTWYAVGLLMGRIREEMKKCGTLPPGES
jgi:hypothetical protein